MQGHISSIGALVLSFGVVVMSMSVDVRADDVIAAGTFEGASDHVTTGGVEVVKTDTGYLLKLQPDFSLDGAPDPKLGFGNDGEYDTATTFSPLNANNGAQTYELPASLDPTGYNEAYVWCEQFSVPLGIAKLQ